MDNSEVPLRRDEVRRRVRAELHQRFGERPSARVKDLNGDPIEWQEKEFKTGIDWVEKIVSSVALEKQHYQFTVPLFHRWLRRRRQNQELWDEAMEKIGKEMEGEGLALY